MSEQPDIRRGDVFVERDREYPNKYEVVRISAEYGMITLTDPKRRVGESETEYENFVQDVREGELVRARVNVEPLEES